jgi:hypothetical protein
MSDIPTQETEWPEPQDDPEEEPSHGDSTPGDEEEDDQ